MISAKPPFSLAKKKLADPWLVARRWYRSELGQQLLENERQQVNSLLEHLFGYNLIQLGCLSEAPLSTNIRTCYHYIFEALKNTEQLTHKSSILSSFEQLPIQSDTVDVVVMPHTLEFEPYPHQILREVERVLVAEGKAVIIGFNPYSLWGVWHKYWEIKQLVSKRTIVPLPSCGHLKSQRRLFDWLQLLGFDVETHSEFFYRPPFESGRLLNNLKFMEPAGKRSWPILAGAYIIVATKRVSTLTPIRPRWKFTKRLLGSDAVEPSAGYEPSAGRGYKPSAGKWYKPSTKRDSRSSKVKGHKPGTRRKNKASVVE